MRRLVSLPLVLLVACTPQLDDEPTDAVDTGALDAETEQTPDVNPFGDGAGCPAIDAGQNQISVGGQARDFTVALPADPEGAPLVFAWHWLGGTASQTLDWMRLGDLADWGVIVVAPESSGLYTEWDYLAAPEASVDIALFDALLVCMWERYGVDTDRIYATGMSAGGLMTSYLTLYRADVLAASAPFSGGIPFSYYDTPAEPLPMMLTWGGSRDSYAGYDFHAASLEFSELLRDDGHFVVECEHSGGHTPPAGAAEMAWDFFDAHPRGVSPEPWADGLPGSLPSYCAIP